MQITYSVPGCPQYCANNTAPFISLFSSYMQNTWSACNMQAYVCNFIVCLYSYTPPLFFFASLNIP